MELGNEGETAKGYLHHRKMKHSALRNGAPLPVTFLKSVRSTEWYTSFSSSPALRCISLACDMSANKNCVDRPLASAASNLAFSRSASSVFLATCSEHGLKADERESMPTIFICCASRFLFRPEDVCPSAGSMPAPPLLPSARHSAMPLRRAVLVQDVSSKTEGMQKKSLTVCKAYKRFRITLT